MFSMTKKIYEPSQIEKKWQEYWQKEDLGNIEIGENSKGKWYTHVMFPYPSGDKLHVGHWYNFAPADTYARFKRMQGYNVFAPMGFDSFGLPAENYAINTRKKVSAFLQTFQTLGVDEADLKGLDTKVIAASHPRRTTAQNVQKMREQLKRMGCLYDWNHEVVTSSPDYYTWTQFLFLTLFKKGLAYKKASIVNWDPIDQTVLANEQVIDGKAERSGAIVEKKKLSQWFFRITNYAEELLSGLSTIDWPKRTKTMQRNWIGKSEGVNFQMRVKDLGFPVEVYDSIPQTYLAQTFTVIAPDHPMVEELIKDLANALEIRQQVDTLIEARKNNTLPTISLEEHCIILTRLLAPLLGSEDDSSPEAGAQEIQKLATLLASTTAPSFVDVIKSLESIVQAANYQDASKRTLRRVATQILEIKFEKEVVGIFTGRYVDNPFGTGDFPIWIASYALADYGTGIVNCSAHDERDFAFAKKYDINLKTVLQPPSDELKEDVEALVSFYREPDAILTMPTELAGSRWDACRMDVIDYIENAKVGYRTTNYRLRDWCVSRQRFWGAPIPIVYDPDGKPHAIPEEHLPWVQPDDVDFFPDGEAPLARSKELLDRVTRIFGKGWTPDTDTMDTFVCSSFYSLRFISADKESQFLDNKSAKNWLPVDVYVGGAEHATKHLLYARFITMALNDADLCPVREPYKRVVHQGLITKGGAKMSKSKGNAVSPDSFVETYGSDVFRMFLMFIGPFSQGGDWPETTTHAEAENSDVPLRGIIRFAKKVYSFFAEPENTCGVENNSGFNELLNQTIEKITHDVEAF